MKSMWIGGIILIVALMAGTFIVAGDSFQLGEDYINDLTMLAGFAIITITVFVAMKYIQQMKDDKAGGELAEENWDGIGEYKNPIPSGWGLAFIGTIIWLMWYWTVGYPTNGFSQIGQWNEEVNEYNAKFESKWQGANASDLTAMGESIFLVQCAPCHGVDGEGINGKAQNLTDAMYTGFPVEALEYSITSGKKGSIGTMPAFNDGRLNATQVKAVATYVKTLSGGN